MCLYNGTPIFNKKRGENIENVRNLLFSFTIVLNINTQIHSFRSRQQRPSHPSIYSAVLRM